MKIKTTLLLFLWMSSLQLIAQNNNTVAQDDYFKENYLRAIDYVYKPNIKSVQFYREGFALTAPIIKLNTSEKLILSFDDLDGDFKRLRYTLIHCDAHWNPSPLQPNEYLNGFFDDEISDYKFSFNTLQKYTHYSLTIPGSRMQPVLAGNYLVKVFYEDEPENLVLTRRMMILDEKLSIEAQVNQPTIVEYRNYKQEIDFSIDKSGYQVSNPYTDLKVIIQQNGRWDNVIDNLKPLYIKGDLLDYNYEEGNLFYGGNIFREIDIKSVSFQTEFIQKMFRDVNGYNVILRPEDKKTFKVFSSRSDINGRMFLKSDDNIQDGDVESEYIHVFFSLKYDFPVVDGNIYIMGQMTDWCFSDVNKMKYNYNTKCYEAELLLKQGYYNYQYVFVENGKSAGDETIIEGTHYEADNEYTLYVYNREMGKTYDVLVGVKQFNAFSK
jgi:hypothetical protein